VHKGYLSGALIACFSPDPGAAIAVYCNAPDVHAISEKYFWASKPRIHCLIAN
jgi:hypothetical protein